MLFQKRIYKLFGFLPVLTVIKQIDEEDLYSRMSKRFKAEMDAALVRARGSR